ncbi:hypothetical protein PsorP6_010391 [Peronosclerospora sorghi]|uniref:Uncharacterized protein n=1 Tax=Peronosclerospora sorghi TaxID=230839 RepID=A0ACC0VWZ1_9STRA|nr:hypothetical protein PsorP6_010391 [Peronosclerospora sorghi]
MSFANATPGQRTGRPSTGRVRSIDDRLEDGMKANAVTRSFKETESINLNARGDVSKSLVGFAVPSCSAADWTVEALMDKLRQQVRIQHEAW